MDDNSYIKHMVSMVRKRWFSIATDLQILINDGTLNNEMSLREAIIVLEKGPYDSLS